ncbi:hypothetical protein J27TS7_10740 [Paenibacillus dendritiformis]|uniref:hypothetical protein n=1 Tax=Paenibacillus dendritiformis TaxID=130049 RepID=UPI001B115084|nr:hypothetical protein [Paenibacillus dendritiformis]GIO71560.1 hypothetical protein J27TS7_10740 [Paenibacillus dendritiformis]
MDRKNAVTILNILNTEAFERNGGEDAYILVHDTDRVRSMLRAAGVTDEQMDESGDRGEYIDLLALAINNFIADNYEKGRFVIWGPIDNSLRHRVINGEGTPSDACRLLKALEPELFPETI